MVRILLTSMFIAISISSPGNSADNLIEKGKNNQKTFSKGAWIQDGKSLNNYLTNFVYAVSTRHALNPSLSIYKSSPYIAWIEINSKGISELYVKMLENGDWKMVGNSLNIDLNSPASSPSLVGNNNNLYISWVEVNNKNIPQVYVRKWDGDHWQQIGNSLNIIPTRYASTPSIALNNDVVYATWAEMNSKNSSNIYVKKWNGSDWEPVGKSLNIDQNMNASSPYLSFQDTIPYVAWSESNTDSIFDVYVKKFNGSDWEQVGKELNTNRLLHAVNPAITFEGNRPFVAFSEANNENIFTLNVKSWDGTKWNQLGKSLNIDSSTHAISSSIAFDGNRPYVIWSEVDQKSVFQVNVKVWNGSEWVRVGNNRINIDSEMHGLTPCIIFKENTPYIAWKEVNKNGIYQIYVKHFEN